MSSGRKTEEAELISDGSRGMISMRVAHFLLVLSALPCITACDPSMIAEAKERVSRDLKDPDSAQFRDVEFCSDPKAVRGDVNSKNAYGAYTGFKPFMYVAGVGSEILSEEADFALWEQLSAICWKKPPSKSATAALAPAPSLAEQANVLEAQAAAVAPATDKKPATVAAKAEPQDLCWQDYCPCEPPQGGADAGICRMLRAGIHVDEEQLAIAAMGRDARQQMSDFEAEHGSFEPVE